ncbi:MAG: D-2-hydroxyacid dehydrogenase [Chloroflexi bacterium]|nr:D-2-hydroxyacid dehydrogenase [Chloroflexota bacterium]
MGGGPGPGLDDLSADLPPATPPGVPRAIALSPILAARLRPQDLAAIRAAAPGARLVTLSREGLADGPLDDVEVLLHGWLAPDAFERLLARAPGLRWIHSAAAGVERLLSPAGVARGLTITNARGVFSRPIAEYVLMMTLAVNRRLPQLLELAAERTWQPLEGRELRDTTLGIVGFGSIGRAIAELAAPFGPRIVATRRSPGLRPAEPPLPPGVEVGGPETFGDVVAAADFVILALPLTPETEDLVDDRVLGLMKRTAWLVNVARGRLVVERALLRALREGTIGGAVLDAFREEPLPPDSPFYALPNVIVTPHTAWSSGRVLDRTVDLFAENLRRYAAGAPLLNTVDPGAGY